MLTSANGAKINLSRKVRLAVGSYDGTVRLWDVATQQQIGSALASGDGDAVRSVAFSPDGNILAAGYGNGVVQLHQYWFQHAHLHGHRDLRGGRR